jgi:predicted 3-demethylubiquinone-9 3-methyltransferase (glyoxalase superfamily)
MRNLTTCLWFDNQAEEAANFYVSIFKNSKMGRTLYYGEAGKDIHGKPAGSVLTVTFEVNGQEFEALNGGPEFKFSEAVSFIVNCESQEEVDEMWDKLLEGGKPQQCGWLKDKYGVSWQIVPTILGDMLQGPDTGRRERVMDAMLQMVKLDIPTLQQAYDGR